MLLLAGALRLGAVADLVSESVMTGFLFGLGLTIMVSQAPSLVGVPAGDGDFFPRLEDLIGGLACVAVLAAGKRFAPVVPWTLVVLVATSGISALFDLDAHGVAVVGDLPTALPDPALPDVGVGDLVDLIAPALGLLVLTAEALGVSRSLATLHCTRSTRTATWPRSARPTSSPASARASSSRAARARRRPPRARAGAPSSRP